MPLTSVPAVPHAPRTKPVSAPARRGGAIASVSIALLVKGAKLLKLGKLLMFGASLAGYGWLYGWRFGAVLTAAILFHEWGHVRAMRLVGVTPKGIWMIPFMGGMAFMNPPQTRGQEAVIALGGPLFGLLSVPVIAGVWPLTGDRAWAAYAAIVALVNLFNLLPIGILDGGRVTQAVAASIHSRLGIAFYGVGMLVGAAAAVWTHSLVIAVILVLGLMETGRNILRGSYDAMPKMTGGPNTLAFLSYLALVLLFLGAIAGLAMIPGADLAARVMGD